MNSTDNVFDDLTRLRGITTKRQQLLRESLYIRTFLDFANRPTAEIEAAFKEKGQNVSRDTIERWQRKARELAAAQTGLQQVVELDNRDTKGEANSPAVEGEWEWCGAFIVEFRVRKVRGQIKERQIRVEQRKIDKKGTWLEDNKIKNSSSIAGERIYAWMLEQLGEEAWTEAEQAQLTEKSRVGVSLAESSSDESSATKAPIKVQVTQIRAFQPPDTDTPSGIGEPNQPFAGTLKSDEPFALEVAFRLPESAFAYLTTREVMYQANFYVRKLDTRVSESVGDSERARLVSGKEFYTARLPEAVLQPGKYRLGVLVKLRNSAPSINYLETSLLQVI